MKHKAAQILFVILFLGLAVVLLAWGWRVAEARKSYLPATGTISHIVTEFGAGDDVTYFVFVDYTDGEGVTHENAQLDTYVSSYREGKEIGILYDPADPRTVTPAKINTGLIVMIAGAVCALIGFFETWQITRRREEAPDPRQAYRVGTTDEDFSGDGWQ